MSSSRTKILLKIASSSSLLAFMTQWKCFVQTHLLFVTTYGLVWSSSVTLVHSNVSLVMRHHFITTHKWSLQRLCFHRCLSVYRGVSAPLHAGIHTPWADTPWADILLGRHRRADTSEGMLGYTHTPLPSACWDTHPPAQCMLGYSQQAGSTHLTGMHSCLVMNSIIYTLGEKSNTHTLDRLRTGFFTS